MLIQVKKGRVLSQSTRKDEFIHCCIFQIVALTFFLVLIPCKLKREEYGEVNKVLVFINPVDGKLSGWMRADKITKA